MPPPSPARSNSPPSGAQRRGKAGAAKENIILKLPKNLVRVAQRPDGIELYFPPLRAPEIASLLGMFSFICIVLPLLAASNFLAAGGSSAHSLLAIALVGTFLVPFPVFGVVFAGFAVYLLTNSLTVTVSHAGIRSVRNIFGVCVRRREIHREDIAAFEDRIAAKYQNLFSAAPQFQLIARHATQPKLSVVIAENLAGETMMAQVRDLIASHAGVDVTRE